jgi:hypothetical protein
MSSAFSIAWDSASPRGRELMKSAVNVQPSPIKTQPTTTSTQTTFQFSNYGGTNIGSSSCQPSGQFAEPFK